MFLILRGVKSFDIVKILIATDAQIGFEINLICESAAKNITSKSVSPQQDSHGLPSLKDKSRVYSC
jgi:hypothetical protein